jgi:hypothetical protein
VRILDLRPIGGHRDGITFAAKVQNYGTGPTRATLSARVGDQAVGVVPSTLDLLANEGPRRVSLIVPRPQLGDLMPECNNEPTLYGVDLRFEVTAGGGRREEVWREPVYDAEAEGGRHEIQQRYWHRARVHDAR